MRAGLKIAASAVILSAMGGCASQGDLPLLFGQTQNVGLTAAASSTTQEVELTLGYKDKNIAVVPVSPLAQADGGANADALSTFGSFELNGEAQAAAANVGLGKFFATGMAARVLSEGFRCAVSNGQHLSCTEH